MNIDNLPTWVFETLDAEVAGELRTLEIEGVARCHAIYVMVEPERLADGRHQLTLVAFVVAPDGTIKDWRSWAMPTRRARTAWALALLATAQIDPRLMGTFGFGTSPDSRDVARMS